MNPDTPLEIQWLAYALAVNNAMDAATAQQLHESLGFTTDLAEFAQAVLEQLCADIDPADESMMVDQIQQLVDYAFEQAASGMAPDWDSVADAAVEYEDEPQYEEAPA
ncbi:MAG: hypothetical protein IKD22_07155, partial [Lentisphaeria bacterium]|nr:hypothetical protein [Lentisphaeria bacterium]